MSTKITEGNDGAGDAAETEDVPTGAEEVQQEPEAKAPVKRKVRRVRIVELVDDEDLDEMLDRLDAEEEGAREPRPARTPAAKKAPAAEEAQEAEEDQEEETDEPRPARTSVVLTKTPAAEESEDAPSPGALWPVIRSPLARTVAVIVVIAALATFGLFEWRQASGLSAKQEARRQVEAALTEFGGVVGTYDTTRIKASQDKIASYMAGDALSEFQANAAKAQTLTDPAKAKVTTVSKARQVIVGNVSGEFATGLIAVDITLTTDQGSAPMSNNYLVIDLVKQKGVWKVSKLTPIGSPADSSTDGTDDSLGTAPGTVPGSTSATPTAKPKK